jgi:hypothetical protein
MNENVWKVFWQFLATFKSINYAIFETILLRTFKINSKLVETLQNW